MSAGVAAGACAWVIGAGLGMASPPGGPLFPDEDTLLLAHFDGGSSAEHARGLAVATGDGRVIEDGRFGGALALRAGQAVRFPGPENFSGEAGTVEFWLRPECDWGPGTARGILAIRSGEHDYLNLNQLADGRIGVATCSSEAGTTNFVYRRVDARDADLRAGEWRHIAACWGGGELSLWLDGRKVASRDGAVGPRGSPEEITLSGSGHAIDEFCISRIARYSDAGRATGQAVMPRARLNPGWKFNEPEGVYRGAAPEGAREQAGMRVVAKDYLDDMDPALPPLAGEARVDVFASPGEIEPAALVVYAAGPLAGLDVSVSALGSAGGAAIGSERITVRRVIRTPMRRLYTAKPTNTASVNRFLPRWKPVDVAAGEFREVWLSFEIPADARPGEYAGAVTLRHAGGAREVPVRLEVLPVRLVEHPRKALATYARLGRGGLERERFLRELRDMRAHGIRHIHPGVAIGYRMADGNPVADLGEVRDLLALLKEAGFGGGTVVVGTGLTTLARLLGHQDLGNEDDGASLDGDEVFARAAKAAMGEFARFQRECPGFRLVASHLDEVFGSRKLLAQYIRLSRAVRQVPEVRLYITFNTVRDESDAMRRELDPFVDLRCNHGYSFEWWLSRGHTMDEYEAELRAGGDEAWFYHNARGVHWTPEWSRIINGLYLWASPFTSHCPWIYQSYAGNPFDDTDGPIAKGHDWVLSAPGPDDPADLVPTRCYEAMREGFDDLRYLAALEAAIETARAGRPSEAAAAQAFLERVRGMIRGARPGPADAAPRPAPSGGAIDADTGLIMGQGTVGSALEAPLIHAIAARIAAEDWRRMRREIADWIVRLR